MPPLLRVFADSLLPVFLTAGAGYLLARFARVPVRPVAQVAFHVLAPCLVFEILTGSEIAGGALWRMVAFTLFALAAPALLAALTARLAGWPRPVAAAVVLVVLLPNAGNYGLSAALLAFGEPGLAQAGVFFVTSAAVTFTAGVLVASLGRASLPEALARLLRVPALWAVVAATLLRSTATPLPTPAERTVALLADAAIPVFLLVLGMQLATARLQGPHPALVTAVTLRLAAGPLLAVAIAPLLGLEGAALQAGVMQAAMPTAVVTTVLAAEFDTEPGFVTGVVLLATVLSPLTLTPLLWWLGA